MFDALGFSATDAQPVARHQVVMAAVRRDVFSLQAAADDLRPGAECRAGSGIQSLIE